MAEVDYRGETLSWTLGDGVLEVALHRTPANEIGTATLGELELLAAFVEGGAAGARALILFSEITAGFSAGADLRELYRELIAHRAASVTTGDGKADVRRFLDRIHHVLAVLDATPLTTISALHGVVMGGGFELALTTDLRIADKSARFAFPELRLGLIPGWGGIPRLERDAGNAVVRDLLLTGRTLGAARAHALGLVSQLTARGEALGAARQLARQVARFDAPTRAAAKAFLKPTADTHPELAARLEREKDIFCDLFTSPVIEPALARFVASQDMRPYLP